MYIQALIWFFVLSTPALSAPVAGLVAAFASTTIGGIIVNAAIGIALSVASSLIANLFKKPSTSRDPGTTVQLRVGGANPLWFPLGRSATAGVRVYYGVWSVPNATPNEYMVDVIALSALPVPSATPDTIRVWMNDQVVTLDTTVTTDERGFPIIEYRKDGQDYAWLAIHNGSQTSANPYLISKFGSRANYPWLPDMIGRGVTYVTLTCRYDKDGLWSSGYPSLLVELPSIPLYDPRLDSTNGGTGPHRWGNFSTYTPSNNAIVRAYNVARGIYHDGEWIFGGYNWPTQRLPVSSWMAAMNACDTMIGGEPQFHGGGTVECDSEAAAVIEELLRSSSALIAEIGGAYKVRVGAPGAPVMSFSDSDIVATREQGYSPFPGLEETFNIARITYTEPGERWSTKESPERRDDTAIAADDNRALPFSVNLPWVTSNLTAQRIGKTALDNGRRFRRHTMHHAPLFWLIEPLDVLSWTSAHNQYTNKEFEVEKIAGNSALFQSLLLRENEPSDYVWNPITDALPYEVVPVIPDVVLPQVVTGWQVFPAAIKDDQGRDRRPSIEVRFDGNLTDVDRVLVQVRIDGTNDVIWDGEVPYPREAIATARVILNGDFPPNVAMNVRGRFVPFTDRTTAWSAWLNVTTPNIKLIPGEDFDPFQGLIGFDDLEDDLADYQDWIGAGRREIERRFEEIELWISDQDFGNAYDRQKIREQVTATYDHAQAQWTYDVSVVASQTQAVANRVETLSATVGSNYAEFQSTATALANADAAQAQSINNLSATVGSNYAEFQSTATALANADAAQVQSIDNLSATVGSNYAEFQSTATALANADTALANSITALDAEVFDPVTGLPAVSSAVTALEAYSGPDGTLANAITSLSAASTSGEVSQANFRMEVIAGPSGYSRIGGEGRVGGAGAWRSAGWYVDVPNNVALPTRFVVQADQFLVLAGANGSNPFAIDGTAVRMNVANIGTVTAGVIRSPDSRFIINLATGSIEWFD